MRDTFVRTLITLAKSNPNIELFTGDLGFGVLKPFWSSCRINSSTPELRNRT